MTSKKLQSTVLGRKFTGRRRSVEERKRTSTCSACGQMGHWAGDSVCTASSKDKPNSKGAGKHGKDGGKGKPVKKAFMVAFPGELCDEPHLQDPSVSNPVLGTSSSLGSSSSLSTPSPLGNPSTFFTFTTAHMVEQDPFNLSITEVIDFAGCMIIDTACQRSCCSSRWLDVHAKILSQYGLKPHMLDVTDDFQFGSGGIHRASKRAYLSAALPGQQSNGLLLGVSVLKDAQIPLLASNTMLEKLGCVVDTVRNRLKFEFIGVDSPLDRIHGHYAVSIVNFWHGISRLHFWEELSSEKLWTAPDPELQDLPIESPADELHERSSRMADSLETIGGADDGYPLPPHLAQYEQDGGHGIGTENMAHHVGAAAHDGGRPDDQAGASASLASSVHPSRVPKVRQQVGISRAATASACSAARLSSSTTTFKDGNNLEGSRHGPHRSCHCHLLRISCQPRAGARANRPRVPRPRSNHRRGGRELPARSSHHGKKLECPRTSGNLRWRAICQSIRKTTIRTRTSTRTSCTIGRDAYK